ncbi:MAG: hypothetical protein L0H93_07460 [Nocardioides sp.]|nr:hypothetical protein [Nocardioides sp.]
MLLSSPLRQSVLRRTTFAAAPLALIAGCKWTDDGSEEATPEQTEPAVAADDKFVAEALEAINTAYELVDHVARKHIGLSTPLAGLTNLHREQTTTLGGEIEPVPRRGKQVPDGDRPALDLVTRQERSLQRTLTGLAGQASSGSLASTLASMSAGVAQHLILLKATKVGGQA